MRLLRNRRTGFLVVVMLSIVGVTFGFVLRPTASLGAPTIPVFDDVSAAAGLRTQNQISFGLQWADYDNDGFPDFYVGRHGGCDADLFRSNGDGTFSDVSASSGVRVCNADRHNCVWGDLNRDLLIDLFCAVNETDHALINQGDGTFVDQGGSLGFGEEARTHDQA